MGGDVVSAEPSASMTNLAIPALTGSEAICLTRTEVAYLVALHGYQYPVSAARALEGDVESIQVLVDVDTAERQYIAEVQCRRNGCDLSIRHTGLVPYRECSRCGETT